MTTTQQAPRIHLERTEIEVGTGEPGYRWVPGYYVVVDGVKHYPPVRRAEAFDWVQELGHTGEVEIV